MKKEVYGVRVGEDKIRSGSGGTLYITVLGRLSEGVAF